MHFTSADSVGSHCCVFAPGGLRQIVVWWYSVVRQTSGTIFWSGGVAGAVWVTAGSVTVTAPSCLATTVTAGAACGCAAGCGAGAASLFLKSPPVMILDSAQSFASQSAKLLASSSVQPAADIHPWMQLSAARKQAANSSWLPQAATAASSVFIRSGHFAATDASKQDAAARLMIEQRIVAVY